MSPGAATRRRRPSARRGHEEESQEQREGARPQEEGDAAEQRHDAGEQHPAPTGKRIAEADGGDDLEDAVATTKMPMTQGITTADAMGCTMNSTPKIMSQTA